MSRCESRRNQRDSAERKAVQWRSDSERYWAREAERSRHAARLAELSERLRGGQYDGRAADVAEADRLWQLLARWPS